jgi:4-hydroxyphenylacetate 3-monooxygenase
MFDLQYSDEHHDDLTYTSPTTGDPVSIFWKRPESKDDLEARRRASKIWMDYTGGMAGRTNDYMASQITAMAISHEFLNTDERAYGDNMLEYYEQCREDDTVLTHALIDPQIDRVKAASIATSEEEVGDRPATVRKVAEREDGIVVSGAKMLGTLGPQAEEIMVWPIGHFEEGEEDTAIAFSIPIDADGLIQICRPSLSQNDKRNHPLASTMDEMDTFVIFDEVFVPWERVFVNGDIDIAKKWRSPETLDPNLFFHQTIVKDWAKAEFALGVAHGWAEAIGIDEYYHVQSKLGEITTMVQTMEACITAAEANAFEYKDTGYVAPDDTPILTATSLFPDMYPRIREILRDIGASSNINVPSYEDLESEKLGEYIETYFRGREVDAEKRLALQKLLFDMVLSGFGGREELYERFYTAGPMRVKQIQYHLYQDKDELTEKALEKSTRNLADYGN